MTVEVVLTLSCPDGPGIVHAVTGFLLERDANITQSQQYGDHDSRTFFLRVQLETDLEPAGLQSDFAAVAETWSMAWSLVPVSEPQRLLVLVSRYGHCLNDLLYRASIGALNVEIVAVVSNHPDLAPMAEGYGVPFHHVPVAPGGKEAAEATLLAMVSDLRVDLVVLARYMQVLSADVCSALAGRAINIHHSMLPSFAGARPYHQAHARGVKLIGATAHYVTAELDAGPIIEQEVARVNHAMTADEVTALGRDVECQALARAVRWHTEHRVLVNGPRTVVLL